EGAGTGGDGDSEGGAGGGEDDEDGAAPREARGGAAVPAASSVDSSRVEPISEVASSTRASAPARRGYGARRRRSRRGTGPCRSSTFCCTRSRSRRRLRRAR